MDKSILPLVAVAASALALPAEVAAAAPNAPGTSRTILLAPLAFLNVEDLLFGSVVVPTTGNGTVYIDPLGAAPVYTNLDPVGSGTVQRGWLLGAGAPGETATVTATLPTALHLDGDTANPSVPVSLVFDHLKYPDGHWEYTVNSSKTFSIYVGGTLTVPAGTAPGTYSNQFAVTATYP